MVVRGNSTPEGNKIDEFTSFLGHSQLITEPTNFEPNENPTCIDLIFSDQPNPFLESGTRCSLDPFCHHQITHCRFIYKIPLLRLSREKYGSMTRPIFYKSEKAYHNSPGISTSIQIRMLIGRSTLLLR